MTDRRATLLPNPQDEYIFRSSVSSQMTTFTRAGNASSSSLLRHLRLDCCGFCAMDEIFKSLNQAFAAQDATRESLRGHRDRADEHVRRAQRALSRLHIAPTGTAAFTGALEASHTALREAGSALKAVESALPADSPGAFYRYNDIWRNALQGATFVAVVLEFIEADKLADVNRVCSLLDAQIRLPLEDYLFGVCTAVAELSRLCMNRVTTGDLETPKRCARFANDVFEAFKQLNFRNDFLRKKYDGMKYDVKRIEEIMYDLSIRGLLQEKSGADVDATAVPKGASDVRRTNDVGSEKDIANIKDTPQTDRVVVVTEPREENKSEERMRV